MRAHSGFGLVGLLATVVILGLMAAISLKAINGAATTTTSVTSTTSRSTPPSTVSTGSAALVAACESDANALLTAVQAYNTLHSSDSIGVEHGITIGDPATYPDGAQALKIEASGFLGSWPTSPAFALSISPTRAGEVAVYVPATSRHAVDFRAEGSTRGCHSLLRGA
jgi:hypothetical protein